MELDVLILIDRTLDHLRGNFKGADSTMVATFSISLVRGMAVFPALDNEGNQKKEKSGRQKQQ